MENSFAHQSLGSLYLMGLKAELTFLHFQFEQILEAHLFDILQEEPFRGLNRFSYKRVKILIHFLVWIKMYDQ